jgi:hypothetical protein
MKITLTTGEAIRLASKQLSKDIGEDVCVEIVEIDFLQTITSQKLQDLWTQNIAPVSLNSLSRPAVIGLIKLYRGLHLEFTGQRASLVDAKIFVETHQRHD